MLYLNNFVAIKILLHYDCFNKNSGYPHTTAFTRNFDNICMFLNGYELFRIVSCSIELVADRHGGCGYSWVGGCRWFWVVADGFKWFQVVSFSFFILISFLFQDFFKASKEQVTINELYIKIYILIFFGDTLQQVILRGKWS